MVKGGYSELQKKDEDRDRNTAVSSYAVVHAALKKIQWNLILHDVCAVHRGMFSALGAG